ncbi:hypothetical protein ES703_78645 [subsurface metagenome]
MEEGVRSLSEMHPHPPSFKNGGPLDSFGDIYKCLRFFELFTQEPVFRNSHYNIYKCVCFFELSIMERIFIKGGIRWKKK